MEIDFKRLFNPLFCIAVGFFNLIFMFMNYCAVFLKMAGDSESEGFSAYRTIKFGDESLAEGLDVLLHAFDKDAKLTFLLVLVSLLLLGIVFISIGLIIVGAIGIVKEYADIELLDAATPELLTIGSNLLVKVNLFANACSAVFLCFSALLNWYSGKVFGEKVSLGLRPGFGMFVLCGLAAGAWYVLERFGGDGFPSAPSERVVHQCSACGAKAKATAKYCELCGMPIVAVQPEQKNDAAKTESSDNSEDSNNNNNNNNDNSNNSNNNSPNI